MTENIMYRYLKSRESINENAALLAALIESKRDIDAVVLDMDKLDSTKQILNCTDLSYCLVNVNNNLVLIYPNEQREQYMNIQPYLVMGEELSEFGGFTYSEAAACREFLESADIKYSTSYDMQHDGKIKFIISKKDEQIMNQAIETISQEEQTDEGRKHFILTNLLWSHTMNQASKAINYSKTGTAFIGSEGGTSGIRFDEKGATVIYPKKTADKDKKRFISRSDKEFEKKVIKIMTDDLNGLSAPLKAVYGDFADILTEDMPKTVITKQEALNTFKLTSIPDLETIGKMIEEKDKYDKKQRESLAAIARMAICRPQKVEGIQEYKMTKQEKQDYNTIHNENIDKFNEYRGKKHEEER